MNEAASSGLQIACDQMMLLVLHINMRLLGVVPVELNCGVHPMPHVAVGSMHDM